MKYLSLLFASAVLTSFAVPVEAAQAEEQPRNEVAQLASRSGWANVNQIKFLEEHASANSGIMKISLGETVTVKALVTYSGDIQPILQSVVQFENVDPALKIEHDPTTLVFNNKVATFTFHITLTQPINRPALFTVKVADGQPGDRQFLTPYSQRQTVEQKAGGSGGVSEPDPIPENPDENPDVTPENPDENPDVTPENPDENPDVTPENPDENPDVTPENPDENPDVTPENPDENPDVTPENPDENPDVTPENPDENPDVTPENPDENPSIKPEKPEGNSGNYEGEGEEDKKEVIEPQPDIDHKKTPITKPDKVVTDNKLVDQIKKQPVSLIETKHISVAKENSAIVKESQPSVNENRTLKQESNHIIPMKQAVESTKELPKTSENKTSSMWILGLLILGMSFFSFRKINE
ncbi:LPXTG cell wall anchor domain-containing protein [Enterococcus sp. DIV1298c]|uniref:LPXTG cell wall anchor domain-containing protein n=1 Tax=Enterococcus sp. DIV1298c TaxID=2815328 RepID=UPI001A91782A|nr:LPXTG cell wall anchor domain-containing protein [Enterococcus sp. DIV1298c]MBO0462179.1 LPXTG cell wall anchor domain-containing protein [Enterococcus sp. DIV1298c]